MEINKPVSSNDHQKHGSLTPLRVSRGIICLLIYISTAFLFLIYFTPLLVFLRFFSTHHSRRATSFLFGIWLALWPFLFEKINKTKVIFSGESVPSDQRVLLISNHRTEVDWMYLWDLALRKGCLGHMKYVLKKSLMKLPLFGWAFHLLEFISVERKWEIDESVMRRNLSTFTDPRDPIWLVVFPEGTDFTEQKCKSSQKYAIENGLPFLNNVLLPKVKGFYSCLEVLRSSLDAVYDVTIAYKHRRPSFMDNAFGMGPSEVHIHVRRFPLSEIPESESEASVWLNKAFQLKDQLLYDFETNRGFPFQGVEGNLSTLRCFCNVLAVFSFTGVFIFLSFFSHRWIKFYMTASCAYLGFAMHFDFRPPCVVDFVRTLPCFVKIKQ